MYYLEKVNFTTSSGHHVSFDENGDPGEPSFDIMNWVRLPDGSAKFHYIGVAKQSTSGEEALILDEDKISWNLESTNVIISVVISNS